MLQIPITPTSTALIRISRPRLSAHEIRFIWWSRSPHCIYCGRRMRLGRSTMDHVWPRSRGGSDYWPNLVLSCRGCNKAKGDRTPLEVVAWALRVYQVSQQIQRGPCQ